MKVALLSFILLSYPALGVQPIVRPTTFDSAASGHSTTPILSRDANNVFFVSDAANLLPVSSTQRWTQVYMRDLFTGDLALLSVNASGEPVSGNCILAGISTNGQLVAFITDAADIVAGDNNGGHDLYVRDVPSGATQLITRGLDGSVSRRAGKGTSVGTVLMSEDGNRIFFETTASNLTAGVDTSIAFGVFAFNRASGTNQLIAKATITPSYTPIGGTRLLSITPDGKRVTFLSDFSSNINSSVTLPGAQVFVRDMASEEIIWASQFEASLGPAYECRSASLAANGLFAAITATTSNSPLMLFRTDLSNGASILVASNVVPDRAPFISSGGQTIVYEDGTNVYRWTAAENASEIVNITTNGILPVSGQSRNAVMTIDGNHVLFCSDSAGLTTNSPGGTFQLYCRDFIQQQTWLVTQTPDGLPSASGTEFSAISVTADGDTVAFDSLANDLAPADENRASDVFVRHRGAVASSMITYRSSSAPRQTALGHASVTPNCVSSNGSRIAFTSWDTDGMPNDTNRLQNGFSADVESGAVLPLTFPDQIRSLAISGNGRYVAAYVHGFLNGQRWARLSRFDLENQTELVITQAQWTLWVNPVPAISSDGNLIASSSFGGFKIFDLTSGVSALYSAMGNSQLLRNENIEALISQDARFVVFEAGSSITIYDRATGGTDSFKYAQVYGISGNARYLFYTTLVSLPFVQAIDVWRRDLATKHVEIVGRDVSPRSASFNGRFVTGESYVAQTAPRQIHLLDCETKETNTISMSPAGEPGNGRSLSPVISADGRYVAYLTDAPNIVPGNAPYRQQVVLRDVRLGQTLLLSASTMGTPGNDHSSRPYFSADGSTIVFQSMASDLTPGDYNNARDLFFVKLGGADSDGDGMDDAWEVTHFGNLSGDGSGDMDGDGALDRDEFMTGTDPASDGSVFRVFTMSRLGGSGRTVIWTGNPARAYRVEYKDDLGSSEWMRLNASISWNGNTARADDPASAAARFYRVVRVP